jgi:peptide deformylase
MLKAKEEGNVRDIMLFRKAKGIDETPIYSREMRDKYAARIATITDDYGWVKTKAREIDLEKEFQLAVKLDAIMRLFRETQKFVGVSSNNIFWNATETPIRQILIPTAEQSYITVINPVVLKMEGEDNDYVEGCGSIPGRVYIVKRKPYVSISGYTLEKQYIELEYGSKDYYAGGQPIFSSYSRKEWIIQHEMDHLEGITIQDRGNTVIR